MVVVAVEYLNTWPFIHGITHAANSFLRDGLLLAPPFQCAELMKNGQADISLVPVAEIPNIEQSTIITDYCIGVENTVRSVVLLHNERALKDLHTIYLDAHSRTSVQLVRILAREMWAIKPRYIGGLPTRLNKGEGMVAIGDKVFEIENRFVHNIDLAVAWRELTGLPFAFAAWVTRTDLGRQMAGELNSALKYGVEHIADAIATHSDAPEYAMDYLTNNIDYDFTQQKREAMELFWTKIKK